MSGGGKEETGNRDNQGPSPQPQGPFGRFGAKGFSSPFLEDQDRFVEDLRRQFEDQRKKMFFDSDPFNDFPRGGSPGPGPGAGARTGRTSANGFPSFDHARDFPNRHPMFSTMRRPAWEDDNPFGRDPFLHRERHNSGSSGGASASSNASTGEEHIIPIRIETGETSSPCPSNQGKAARAQHHLNQQSPPNPISSTPIPMPAPEGMSPSPTPEVHMQHIPMPGPQRSSTDEVRKSPSPCPGERSPRSMSAPPESAPGPKFVSSVNMQVNQDEAAATAATPESQKQAQPQPQPTQLGGKNSKGQKEPSPTPNANAGQGGKPIPIFVEGRGPVHNHNHNHQGQAKVSRPAEQREVTPPPAPPKKPAPPKDPLEKVADITNDVKDLEKQVDEYKGTSKDKRYLFLDEMLTRNLIKLDVIETEGREDVRNARKDCIKLIQACISKLESKVPSKMEVGGGDSHETKMETEENKAEEGKVQSQPPAASTNSNSNAETVKVTA